MCSTFAHMYVSMFLFTYIAQMFAAAAAAKSHQSCLTLCDPIDGSTPGSASLGFSRQEHGSGLPLPSPAQMPKLFLV